MSLDDTKTWAMTMFGSSDLKHKRRTDRLVKVAEKVVENPTASFPDQLVAWADLKAAYRLFDCDEVTFECVAEGHWKNTRQQARGRTLVICDTTEIDFGGLRTIEGVGPTGNGSGQGFLLHNALMVDAGTKSIVGIAGQTLHHRPQQPHSKKKESRWQSSQRKRESEVWGHVIDQIGPPAGEVQYVYVCDRGADNFEVFCHLRQQHGEFVIRASAKNRSLQCNGEERLTLGDQIETGLSVLGHYELNLRARPGQAARTVKIQVSSGAVVLPVPQRKTPMIRELQPEPIPMNVVLVREVNAPEDVTPIEWVLYTSLPVETFEQAWEIIEYYESRWLIEEYHKALKTGTNVTKRQLHTSKRLEPMVGLMSVVAVRLLALKTIAKTNPTCPAQNVIPPLWLKMLTTVRKKMKNVHALTIYEFYREVAKLGGFLGRKSDGEPGWITIWRGWEKLNTLVQGAQLALDLQ